MCTLKDKMDEIMQTVKNQIYSKGMLTVTRCLQDNILQELILRSVSASEFVSKIFITLLAYIVSPNISVNAVNKYKHWL